MSEVSRVVGSRQVAIALDIQLTRLIASLNLKWNISDAQIKTIVEDIIDKFPNESIEDFIMCFKKARQGEYGELFRLDSAVVFVWIQRYLDEKYEALEAALAKLKTNDYHERIPKDKSSEEGPGYRLFKEYVKEMTKKCGDEIAPRKKVTDGYKYFTVRNLQIMAMSQQHAEEIVELMIQRGDLIEDNDAKQA